MILMKMIGYVNYTSFILMKIKLEALLRLVLVSIILIILSIFDFLNANNGKYYFNSNENDDVATAYWNDFRNEYLDSYKGQFIFLYTTEEFKITTGYDNMMEFMFKTGTNDHFYHHL